MGEDLLMVCLFVFPKGRLKNSILEEEAPICRSMKLHGDHTTSLLLVPTSQIITSPQPAEHFVSPMNLTDSIFCYVFVGRSTRAEVLLEVCLTQGLIAIWVNYLKNMCHCLLKGSRKQFITFYLAVRKD